MKNKEYLKDIETAKGLFSENEFIRLKSNNYTNCTIQEKSLKRIGKTMNNCNSIQLNFLRSIPSNNANIGHSYPINFNNNNMAIFGPKFDFNSKNLNSKLINLNEKNKKPKDNLKIFMKAISSKKKIIK